MTTDRQTYSGDIWPTRTCVPYVLLAMVWGHIRNTRPCGSYVAWVRMSVCLSVCASRFLALSQLWLTTLSEKFMSANGYGIIGVTGRAHCQRQVAFFSDCHWIKPACFPAWSHDIQIMGFHILHVYDWGPDLNSKLWKMELTPAFTPPLDSEPPIFGGQEVNTVATFSHSFVWSNN